MCLVRVKVVEIIICPSCTIMQMQGAHGVCALRVQVYIIMAMDVVIVQQHGLLIYFLSLVLQLTILDKG